MARDAEATRARLLTAARKEFAAYGIAGARVDRIAADASSNKAQIYHYFGSKDALFDAVFEQVVDQIVNGVPIDVDDLPGYAARLSAMYRKSPDVLRLATWQRLERGEENVPAAVEATRHKVSEIERAQADGRLTARYPAEVLLAAVLHIAELWAEPSREAGQRPRAATTQRQSIEQLVRDVVA